VYIHRNFHTFLCIFYYLVCINSYFLRSYLDIKIVPNMRYFPRGRGLKIITTHNNFWCGWSTPYLRGKVVKSSILMRSIYGQYCHLKASRYVWQHNIHLLKCKSSHPSIISQFDAITNIESWTIENWNQPKTGTTRNTKSKRSFHYDVYLPLIFWVIIVLLWWLKLDCAEKNQPCRQLII
jgi:hypothetical protein